MNSRLIALHGFLGKKSDWDFLSIDCEKVDLQEDYRQLELGAFRCAKTPDLAFQAWVELFIQRVPHLIHGRHGVQAADRPILLGYSLGGRLAMHALVAYPERFSGAIFVSAHPGMGSTLVNSLVGISTERKTRMASDQEWAQRFEGPELWDELIASWNSQSVFQGGVHVPERKEADFDRKILAAQLRSWSLARQRDLLPELSKLSLPVLWIAGEHDEKYRQKYQELAQWSNQRPDLRPNLWIVPGVGHRAPWDQPHLFRERVLSWIFQLTLDRE